MSQANVDLVREIYDLWLEGKSARHLIAEDLEYVNPSYAVESGTRRERRALASVREIGDRDGPGHRGQRRQRYFFGIRP